MSQQDSPAEDEPTNDDDASAPTEQTRLSPALIATLVTIPIMVITGFIVFAVMKNNEVASTPIENYPTSTLTAETNECGKLIAELPDSFGDYRDKEVDGNVVRWINPDSDSNDPLVMRCGVARPEGLAPTSSLQGIGPVQWFITESQVNRGQAFVLVDRRPYVAVWVPQGAGNAAITDISGLLAKLPEAPLDFGS